MTLCFTAGETLAQTTTPQKSSSELRSVEKTVAARFAAIRGPKLSIPARWDIRTRQEACAIAAKNTLPKTGYFSTTAMQAAYVTVDPNQDHPVLALQANRPNIPKGSQLSVGAWFSSSQDYPQGAYWIVLRFEEGAFAEWFWDHWYLTDGFEYRKDDKSKWMQRLPLNCRDLK